MIWRWVSNIARSFSGVFRRPPQGTDRSQLVGMYLDQTNRGARPRTRGYTERERRDGRFAQNRRRENH